MRMCVPVRGLFLALVAVLRTSVAFAPVPRITWEHGEVGLVQFHEPGIFNYSALLMSDDKGTLYVGAREAVFAVNALDISEKQHEVGPVASQPCSCRRGCLRYLPISSLHRPGSRLPQDAQVGCSHVSSVLSSTLSGHL